MGYGTTRSLERVAAAMGELDSAPVRFEAAADITEGGVLLALPALLALGLLRYTPDFYKLPKGYYGIDSIFLLLAMMALARLTSIEQLRYVAPGEWGDLLGLDRVPEVRCLRSKLALLSGQEGQAAKWNTELAKDWMGELPGGEMLFYIDGHVRVYHSRISDRTAPALRGATAVVSARDHGLLDQRHGRSTVLLREPGSRPRTAGHHAPGFSSVAGGECAGPGRAPGMHGGGCPPTLVHAHLRPGRV
jgi:hypothetical protein